MAALAWADVVVICPSNPFVSIDPVLALPGVRDAVAARPVLAVSPIIGGEAVKGPAAKMFRELIGEPSALAVAEYYRGLLAGFFVDRIDVGQAGEIEKLGVAVRVEQTLMPGFDQRVDLAREVLGLAAELGS
jgi:LPPG:FO 2-phospho-L-lactate transferase